jgi:hypothetical protein
MISGTILPPISTSLIPAVRTRTPDGARRPQQGLEPNKIFKKSILALDDAMKL